jgi:DNA (cytosine-5)-methyltransferase 1
MIPWTVADLFCGAGGMSLGFRQAGFDPVFAADFDPHACRTYAENLGPHVERLDLCAAEPAELASHILATAGPIGIVAGGPPCQGWSVQGRGKVLDPRNDLTLRFAVVAALLQPMAIVMENVPTVLGKRGRRHMECVERILGDADYRVSTKIVDAAWYGVPQVRRRAILVALSNRVDATFEFPSPTHGPADYVTVRQAIADMPCPPPDGSAHPAFPNHRRVLASAASLERLSYVPEGGGRADVPLHMQLPCHRNDNGHRHLDVFGRLWWDRPSGTITAMFDNFTRGRFAHPSETRNITAREGARLQSFPDSFVFFGPKKDVARQIGNAVPPALAKAIAIALRDVLERGLERQGVRKALVDA